MKKIIEKIMILIKIILLVKNPKNYFLDYFKKLKKIYQINLRDGRKVLLRGGTSDRLIFNDLFIRKEYNLKKLNKNSVILDIGAHIGLFSLVYAKKCKKIFCFEPSKENFFMLKKNLKLNGIDNVKVYNLAVYPSHKKMNLSIGSSNCGSFSLIKKGKKYETVKVFHPKKFSELDKNIDIIKMDCEGSEFEIFPYLNLNNLKEIIFEYHLFVKKEKDLKEITKILNLNQFKLKKIKYNKFLGIIHGIK